MKFSILEEREGGAGWCGGKDSRGVGGVVIRIYYMKSVNKNDIFLINDLIQFYIH